MKKLIAILSIFPLLVPQVVAQTIINTGNHRQIFNVVSCNPPTMTSRWAAYNPSNLCTGSVPCTNGANVISVPDLAGSANSAGSNPVYTTGSINSLPTFTFTNNGDQIFFTSGAADWAVSGAITFYAVLKPTSTATNRPIVAVAVNAGPEWRINTTGKQEFLSQGTTSIGIGTATISTSAYSTLAMTYDYTSHVLNFYICSGGTCSSDGTATTSASFSGHQSVLAWASPVSEQFKGDIAEWGYLTTADTTGIAAWSLCKYGI